jgi:hypothetical protein
MALSRVLATAVLAAALAVPATAGTAQAKGRDKDKGNDRPPAQIAIPKAKAPTPLSAAAAVGRRYWGGAAPCMGQVTILAQRPLAPGLSPATDAWVTFDSPLGANNLAAPASSYTNCTISFARWRWPTSASMREDWEMFCLTMTHELGHLLGRPHDLAPGSVMAPVFTDNSSVPRICRTARRAR